MSKKKMVPDIRFEGFEGEWESRKISEVLTVNSGRDYKHLKPGDIPVYGTGGYMLSVDKALSHQDAIGIGRKGTIDRPQRLGAPFWTVDTLFYLEPNNSDFLDFLFPLMETVDWRNHDESTGVPSLSRNKIDNIIVKIPDLSEQYRVGRFLEIIDSNIKIKKNELIKLKQSKQAMLQKMFPKEGETVPEIRFDGFEEDWKEVKIKNLVGYISDGDWIQTEYIYANGEYRIIQTGNISQGIYLNKDKHSKYIKQDGFDELKGNEVYPGDILTSRLAEPAGRTIIMPDINNRMVTSVDVMIVRPNKLFDSYFFMTQMNTNRVLSDVEEKVSGTSHRRISRKNLENILVRVTSLKEQERIGNYFKELDQVIESKQSELSKLKQFKQSMLDKMFV